MPNHPLDLSGRTFGFIRVLHRSGISPRGAILWACHCDRCDQDFEVDGSRLVSGKNDCGCSTRERRADLTGQHIGILTVLRRAGIYSSGDILYTVRCDICGKEKEMPASTIRAIPKSCGCQRWQSDDMRAASLLGISAQIIDGISLSAAKSNKPNIGSTTGARGVSYIKKRRCYCARCMVGGKKWYKYGFKSVDDAKKARDEAHDEMVEACGILQLESKRNKEREIGKHMKYFINYNTGAGNDEVNGTLDDAKRIAESGMSYTQRDVEIYKITNDEKEIVSSAKWWGVSPSEDDIENDNVLFQFGDFGFYSKWVDA